MYVLSCLLWVTHAAGIFSSPLFHATVAFVRLVVSLISLMHPCGLWVPTTDKNLTALSQKAWVKISASGTSVAVCLLDKG